MSAGMSDDAELLADRSGSMSFEAQVNVCPPLRLIVCNTGLEIAGGCNTGLETAGGLSNISLSHTGFSSPEAVRPTLGFDTKAS